MVAEPQSGAVCVAIVNDYDIVVAGVAALLAEHAARVQIVQLAANTAVTAEVDVILFDTFGQRLDTDAYLTGLITHSRARVAVFTWRFARDAINDAMALGASGYLSKALDAEEIVSAIERIHAGEIVVSQATSSGGVADAGDWPGRETGLTPRESEVLSFIAQGLSNEEITARAYVGLNSLKTHIRSAYRKIGVTNRSQAIVWCVRNGFHIDPAPPFDGRR